MRVSTLVELKELRNEFRILPHVLNVDSDDTVDTGITNISLVIHEKNIISECYQFSLIQNVILSMIIFNIILQIPI